MAKINIVFNNINYLIDESLLAAAVAELQTHLSAAMSGSGASITLDGVSYGVDSTKLATATTAFVNYLGTVTGTGYKVKVDGVEYNVASDKMSGAVTEMETVLGGLHSDDIVSGITYTAGLYQTGAIALYEEQGADAISDMLITPWDKLVDSGAIVIDNGVVRAGLVTPDNLPEKNEYGFYFGVSYQGSIYYEDGSFEYYEGGELLESFPAGTVVYSANTIDMSSIDYGVGQVLNNGLVIDFGDGFYESLGELAQFNGDLIMHNGSLIATLDNGLFARQYALTGVIIPDSVTNMGINTFASCTSLTKITIPSNITSIDHGVFGNCTGLTSVVIPESVTSIGSNAFYGCTGLTSVVIPESVTNIGSNAFYGCTGLMEIKYNAIECTGGERAFSNNTTDGKRISLIIGKNVKKIPYLFGDISNTTYAPKIVSVIFEEGSVCESIEANAFWNCTDLADIVIPNSLTTIGNRALWNCTSLNNITFEGTIEEWNIITKGTLWNENVLATYVQCSDGVAAL